MEITLCYHVITSDRMKLKCPKGSCDRFYKKDDEYYCFHHRVKAKKILNLVELADET